VPVDPLLRLRRRIHDGDEAARRSEWATAAKAYREAVQHQAELARAQSTRMLIERVLTSNHDLPSRLAHALAMTGDLWGAVAALENGRTRLLAEGLSRSRLLAAADHDGRLGPYATRYRDLSRKLEELEAVRDSGHVDSLEGTTEIMAFLTDQLARLYGELRQIPGYEQVGLPVTSATARTVLNGRDIAYVSATPQGGFFLHHGEDTELTFRRLPEVNSATLAEWGHRYVQGIDRMESDFESAVAELDSVCRWLCSAIVHPLRSLTSTEGSPRPLYIVACSWFSILPIHAAWEPDPGAADGRRYPLLEAGVVHVPNAQILRNLAEIGRVSDKQEDVLIVAEPDADMAGLPASVAEARSLRAVWKNSQVLWRKPDVLAAIPKSSLVHFATHGVSRPERPLASALLVQDDWISVSELLRVRFSRSPLCILSACHTGAIGLAVPDESTGLVTGLLAAGAAGVIASAWPVDDLATSALMILLHRQLQTSSDWLHCLTLAQSAMRVATVRDLRSFTELDGDDNSHPFSHPFYWAGFYYSAVR
jgi:hypothetical protein